MAKECVVCKNKIGILTGKVQLADGWICTPCYKELGGDTKVAHLMSAKYQKAEYYIKKKEAREISKLPKERKVFTLNEAIDVYICTDHQSCKSNYLYNEYFEDAFTKIIEDIPSFQIEKASDAIVRKEVSGNPVHEFKNITISTSVSKLRNFIVIDTETTGLQPLSNDIIEVGAIKFENFRPVEKFHTYLKPSKPIPAQASAVNGITDDIVADCPTFAEIIPSLQKFIGDSVLVAHNASFDMDFLHVCGLDLSKHSTKVYDTLDLSRKKIRDYSGDKLESYKLESVCKELNIRCSRFHAADADALAAGLLFVDIIKQVHEVDNAISLIMEV